MLKNTELSDTDDDFCGDSFDTQSLYADNKSTVVLLNKFWQLEKQVLFIAAYYNLLSGEESSTKIALDNSEILPRFSRRFVLFGTEKLRPEVVNIILQRLFSSQFASTVLQGRKTPHFISNKRRYHHDERKSTNGSNNYIFWDKTFLHSRSLNVGHCICIYDKWIILGNTSNSCKCIPCLSGRTDSGRLVRSI
jgi:hypothetical protein